jgi:glycosyltransferase involved in cell wall biosynthesis
MNPQISVVMSAYNHDTFIKESIESILNQTFTDFELIIINDNSIDNTEDIIKSFNDKRITYIKNNINLGTTKSTNLGFKMTRGEYVCIICSDDILPNDSLEVRYNFIKKYNLEAVHTGLTRIENNIQTYIKPVKNNVIIYFIKQKPKNIGLNMATFLFKTQSLRKIGYLSTKHNTKYNRDYELGLRTILKLKTGSLNINTYNYLIHQTNRSHSNWKLIESQRNFKSIEKKYLKLFKNLDKKE